MTAGQLFSDVEAILSAPLHAHAKTLWLYVLTQGGWIEQTREEIAHALNISVPTVTSAAGELEETGWIYTFNRHKLPKIYRVLRPYRAALPESIECNRKELANL